jgi:hypothetical protein
MIEYQVVWCQTPRPHFAERSRADTIALRYQAFCTSTRTYVGPSGCTPSWRVSTSRTTLSPSRPRRGVLRMRSDRFSAIGTSYRWAFFILGDAAGGRALRDADRYLLPQRGEEPLRQRGDTPFEVLPRRSSNPNASRRPFRYRPRLKRFWPLTHKAGEGRDLALANGGYEPSSVFRVRSLGDCKCIAL